MVETVESLLFLDYKLFEIVIVNDGSSDHTGRIVADHFNMAQVDMPIRRRIPCKAERSVYKSRCCRVSITLVSFPEITALRMILNFFRILK